MPPVSASPARNRPQNKRVESCHPPQHNIDTAPNPIHSNQPLTTCTTFTTTTQHLRSRHPHQSPCNLIIIPSLSPLLSFTFNMPRVKAATATATTANKKTKTTKTDDMPKAKATKTKARGVEKKKKGAHSHYTFQCHPS
jgi:septal ring-binding cell division protein DamX